MSALYIDHTVYQNVSFTDIKFLKEDKNLQSISERFNVPLSKTVKEDHKNKNVSIIEKRAETRKMVTHVDNLSNKRVAVSQVCRGTIISSPQVNQQHPQINRPKMQTIQLAKKITTPRIYPNKHPLGNQGVPATVLIKPTTKFIPSGNNNIVVRLPNHSVTASKIQPHTLKKLAVIQAAPKTPQNLKSTLTTGNTRLVFKPRSCPSNKVTNERKLINTVINSATSLQGITLIPSSYHGKNNRYHKCPQILTPVSGLSGIKENPQSNYNYNLSKTASVGLSARSTSLVNPKPTAKSTIPVSRKRKAKMISTGKKEPAKEEVKFKESVSKCSKIVPVMSECDDGEIKSFHNVNERTRRDNLRTLFVKLRDKIPEYAHNERASKVNILQGGVVQIKRMEKENIEAEMEIKTLNEKKNQLKERLSELEKGDF